MCITKNMAGSDLTSEVKVCIKDGRSSEAASICKLNILYYSTLLFLETQNIGTFIVSTWIVTTPPSLATCLILYVATSNRTVICILEIFVFAATYFVYFNNCFLSSARRRH